MARIFFHRAIALPEVTGDTSECVLYLCTEGIPQDETCPLREMQFSRQRQVSASSIPLRGLVCFSL